MATKQIEAAVRAWQLYHGSSGYVPIRTQQRLYDRAKRLSATLARRYQMSERDVIAQLTTEASKLGHIRPQPGRDI